MLRDHNKTFNNKKIPFRHTIPCQSYSLRPPSHKIRSKFLILESSLTDLLLTLHDPVNWFLGPRDPSLCRPRFPKCHRTFGSRRETGGGGGTGHDNLRRLILLFLYPSSRSDGPKFNTERVNYPKIWNSMSCEVTQSKEETLSPIIIVISNIRIIVISINIPNTSNLLNYTKFTLRESHQ